MKRYKRLAPDSSATVDAASRVVRYVFSDESVGRDGHIVKATAWRTDGFLKNPVFLWAHLDEEPPIGRVFDLHTENRTLCGAVKYAETEFADSIYQLVRANMINATSMSWLPIEYDRMESGGYCFTAVDLLEISQVCIPALPTALATARSRGLNIKPIADWAACALETRRYEAVPRRQLEAIYRSASPKRKPMNSNNQEAQARRKREAIVSLIKSGVPAAEASSRVNQRGVSPANAEKVREIQAHHQRCQEHHGEMADSLDALAEVHKRMTSTLEELSYGRSAKSQPKVMEDAARCMRALTKSHDGMGEALGDVTGCVDDLLGTEEAGRG